MPLTRLDAIDDLLAGHAAAIGRDFEGYRNHVHRVARFCLALLPRDGAAADDAATLERVCVAAVMHDIGIWTAGTFDYLEPSVAAATRHLARTGRESWTAEVAAMIREHHKVTPYRGAAGPLVEPFRRADWTDVTYGALRFGLPRALVGEVRATWPDAGFHRRLAALSLHRLRTHPWSPLPMLRL